MAMTVCRLLRDPPARGAWNMAADEVLLDEAAAGGEAIFRTYTWSEPTLSLGYFQKAAERFSHPPSLACPLVRRLTGGGAIVHDQELTYSVVLPREHPLARRRERLYEEIHRSLIECLAHWSIESRLSGATSGVSPEPFLCFQRRTELDVVLANAKIAGSAQRRRRAAVLQHGSILLGRSSAAPELAGLSDLVPAPISAEELAEAWLTRIAQRLGWTWRPWVLDASLLERVRRVAEEAYGTDSSSSAGRTRTS